MKKLFFIMIIIFSITSCASLSKRIKSLEAPKTITVPDQFDTIQEAIDMANDGDTIFVKNGIYKGNIELSKAVSLIGESPTNTIIIPDESENEYGIDVSFSIYEGYGYRKSEHVEISSLQIRNFKSGIVCAHRNIKSINNCVLVSSPDLGSRALHLQGTDTPVLNCTIIGNLLIHSSNSSIENCIIRYLPTEINSFINESVFSISSSPELIISNNVIWGDANAPISTNNIFSNPNIKNIENQEYQSDYSASNYGIFIESQIVIHELDETGPEIFLDDDISTEDLNIVDRKDLQLHIKVFDNSPIANILIESETINCLDDFNFERTRYLKEIERTIILHAGYNTINLSSEDIHGNKTSQTIHFQLGTDSIPKSTWINDNESDPVPNNYSNKIALSIGIQQYSENLPEIRYAVNDAMSINELLNKNGYKTLPIVLNPTLYELKKALLELEKQEKEYDKVIIYISGHGANESTMFSNSYGLILPVDVQLNDLSLTAFPMEEFRNYIRKLEAKTVIIILDMCFSAGGKGIGSIPKDANNNYITKILSETGQGKILLTSSGDLEQSFEDTEFEHGVFTYYLLEAVEKGKISIDSIYDYIYESIRNSNKWSQRPRKIFLSDDIEGFHTLF